VIDTVTGAEAAGSGQQTALPLWWAILIAVFVAWQAWLNVPALRNLFSPAQLMNASFNRWGLGNAYGAFGSMTETRDEIIIEGWIAPDEGGSGEGSSGEDDPGEDGGAVGEADLGDGGGTAGGAAGWREYRFKGKPGDVERISPLIAPYHLRLDWLMWFAALGDYRQAWFSRLIERIGSGDEQIRRLIGPDPFDGRAPELVRVRVFTYRYATRAERRAAAAAGAGRPWWVRSNPRILVRPTDLRVD
jgi:hypothetical protein